jgi:UTP--glucose-1-phosphate uridylyltransferase
MTETALEACRRKMEAAGAPSWQIERFAADFLRLGEGAYIGEAELGELPDPVAHEQLPTAPIGELLRRTAVIKLNGGLGTSMGLQIPKSMVEVREGQNFLDLAARQILHLREQTGTPVPLVLMHSFHTQTPCLERLAEMGFDNGPLGLDFLQSQVPKLRADDHFPVEHPAHSDLEWCPPGHGEIYAALQGTGWLERLIEAGYEFAFVSNIDNLGATLDERLLHWFASSGLDFAMEVTRRTELDKKGGHLASRDGRLLLRERAQCRPEDLAAFEDVGKHRFFNTNNLWLNLRSLQKQPLPVLPLIVNQKTVDPTDKSSTPVLQLESAMGAAIATFPNTAAVAVSRERFMPVKTLSDLLLLRSDLYELSAGSRLQRTGPEPLPAIELDSKHFGTYQAFAERVSVVPSLRGCTSLKVVGDVRFDRALQCRGDWELTPDGVAR